METGSAGGGGKGELRCTENNIMNYLKKWNKKKCMIITFFHFISIEENGHNQLVPVLTDETTGGPYKKRPL